MTLDTARVLDVGDGLVLGGFGQFFVVVYTGAVCDASVRRIEAAFDAFRARARRPFGLYTVVEEQAPLPPASVRDGLARFLANAGTDVEASALVQEGSGFRAAAVRSVAVGLSLVARQPYPHKVFSTVAEASQWLVRSFAGVRPDELSDAVAAIRRADRDG